MRVLFSSAATLMFGVVYFAGKHDACVRQNHENNTAKQLRTTTSVMKSRFGDDDGGEAPPLKDCDANADGTSNLA